MDLPVVHHSPDEYTQTSSGNKIFRNAFIHGSQNIVINGKSILMRECMLRGDLSAIRMGKYCIVGERVVIRGPHKKFPKAITFMPVHIGDHVLVEEDCVIMAAQLGGFCHIGRGAVLGRNVVIKECCRVEPGSVVAADSVFPPFSVIAGNPAKAVGQTPECTQDLMTQATRTIYDNFIISR